MRGPDCPIQIDNSACRLKVKIAEKENGPRRKAGAEGRSGSARSGTTKVEPDLIVSAHRQHRASPKRLPGRNWKRLPASMENRKSSPDPVRAFA